MLRTDKSVGVLTGMIIAALYVILLVGFSRESYMRRDAAGLAEAAFDMAPAGDVSKRVCRTEQPICAALFADASERQSCSASIDTLRQVVSEPVAPLTLQSLRRALRADR